MKYNNVWESQLRQAEWIFLIVILVGYLAIALAIGFWVHSVELGTTLNPVRHLLILGLMSAAVFDMGTLSGFLLVLLGWRYKFVVGISLLRCD